MFLFGKNKPDLIESIKESLLKTGIIIFKKYKIEIVVYIDSETNKTINGSSEVAVFVFPLKKEEFWVFRQELGEAIGYPVDVYS
jgi:hypothetical protein